jgi:AGZA family xanthine/uracil permease-like MFS transporter
MALIDTMGSLLGVSSRAGFLDERGNLPRIAQPMLCDALATVFAALAGTKTSGAFIESAAGVQAGGRTRFDRRFHRCAFRPVALLRTARNSDTPGRIWSRAGDHRLYVMAPIGKIDFDDPTELIPASR